MMMGKKRRGGLFLDLLLSVVVFLLLWSKTIIIGRSVHAFSTRPVVVQSLGRQQQQEGLSSGSSQFLVGGSAASRSLTPRWISLGQEPRRGARVVLRNQWSSSSSSPQPETEDTTTAPIWKFLTGATVPVLFYVTIPTLIADASAASGIAGLSAGDFDPNSFQPVCPASDVLYRFLQSTAQAVVGEANFIEYGPLIAGGLLRVRLELCVVESFFNEAVGPFVRENGLSWILPWHETVETFLAGTVFALATTFILVGSTKIVSVMSTYTDVFLGVPCRVLGGFAFDRARGKPVTLDIGLGPFQTRLVGPPKKQENAKADNADSNSDEWMSLFQNVEPVRIPIIILSGSVKLVGDASKIVREVVDGLDLFVGRYLVLIATGYIGLKFLHFKVFPDFP